MALKIQKIKIHNFRNVPDQDINLNGCNLLCFGDNMVGKSNLITAVNSLLLAKFPNGSIAHGMNEADIEAVLAEFERGDDPSTWVPIEGTEHKMRAHIYRDKNNAQKVDLELHYPNGGADDKVTPIRSYIGQAEQNHFVELARTAEGRNEQLNILRSMFPEETQETLRQLETRIRIAEKDRTKTGQSLKDANGYVKKANILQADVEKYTIIEADGMKLVQKIDVLQVSKNRELAIAHNSKVGGAITRRNERLEYVTTINKLITEIEAHTYKMLDTFVGSIKTERSTTTSQILATTMESAWKEISAEVEVKLQRAVIVKLSEECIRLDEQNVEANQWINDNELIDLTPFDKQLSEASTFNSMVDKVAEYLKLVKEAEDLQAEYGELDALVNSTREAFKDTVRSFDLPVIGMTFDDTTVMYNGKPADEANTSKAERMIINIMVSIAQLGRAQILFVEECESMGSNLYNEFRDLCDANGIQCFIEQVERQDKPELRLVVECERPQANSENV